ncbi:MAG: AAA family ATPase [Lachnospiraceae bacterium]|nr:AAA family ATPase [Lachnospiraceae bacterium]
MRYYALTLKTNNDQIKETQKVRIKDYGYYSVIAGMNNYVFDCIRNGVNFFAYREEENRLLAAFSYNEQSISYDAALSELSEQLNSCFEYKGMSSEPYEITTYDYIDAMKECRRHQYTERWSTAIDNAKLWLYEHIRNDMKSIPYEYKEIIISDEKGDIQDIYDESLKNELINIREHSVKEADNGVMAHYFVSAGSYNAAEDMINALALELYNAGRITTKRISIVSDMVPNLYSRDNNFENMIENSYGGIVVYYLKESLGHGSSSYGMNCQYISKLFRRYRNKCVFVFAYEKNRTGFAYKMLPEIRKNAICVELKEGKGDKNAAEKYLRTLVKKSELSTYVSSVKEFMKQYKKEQYSQTDVLDAFERFEPWCLNRKMKGMYSFDPEGKLLLDRDTDEISSYDKLQNLIGLNKVKEQIDCVLASYMVDNQRRKYEGKDFESGALHMIFAGNPGTAKTTVARLFAGIAKERGIIESGVFVEIGGMDLNHMHPIIMRNVFDEAKGGVLFVDEAYALCNPTPVATFIQEMENHRDEVIVIMAGYNERMETFLKANEGLKSRIPHWIDFPDYNADELTEIFLLMTKERNFTVKDDAIQEAKYIFKKAGCIENFGNGRYVRNLMDKAVLNQASRLVGKYNDASDIKKSALFTLIKEDITALEETPDNSDKSKAEKRIKEERKAGDAAKELDNMIGLKSVKDIIHKAVANARLNKICMDKGIRREKTSMHMIFTGNPGTAKTTVARLFAEIMKDEKILDLGKFVEVGRADLIGSHVGETAPMVKEKFKEAQGGVLFIDEAYSLVECQKNSFGDEAISTIVQEMENQRDKVVVIFAGYPEPMKEFLDRNPGMKSRIAFQVNFDDYSKEELCDITKLMLSKKNYTLEKKAMKKIENILDKVIGREDFGNGRFVRKMIEKAELNLAERLMSLPEEEISEKLVTTLEVCDIPGYDDLNLSENDRKSVPFGFAC